MFVHFAGNERDRLDCKLGAHDDQEVTARPVNVEHFRSLILHVLVHEHDVWLSVGQFRLFFLRHPITQMLYLPLAPHSSEDQFLARRRVALDLAGGQPNGNSSASSLKALPSLSCSFLASNNEGRYPLLPSMRCRLLNIAFRKSCTWRSPMTRAADRSWICSRRRHTRGRLCFGCIDECMSLEVPR